MRRSPFYDQLAYAAPLLLALVAGVQRYLVEFQSLDPWKGGGFGMFSAISAQNTRRMTITLVTTENVEKRFPPYAIASRIPMGGEMQRRHWKLITMPTAEALASLAREIADAEWVEVTPNATQSSTADGTRASPAYYRMRQDVADEDSFRPLEIIAARVEIWEYILESHREQLKLTSLISVSEATSRN